MLPTTNEPNKALTTNDTWGTEGASSKDFVLSRIVIAQASADKCKEGVARPGQLVDSKTNKVLADKGASLALLPIAISGLWKVTTPKPPGGGFADFIRNESLTLQNDSDRWTIEKFEEGKPVLWNKILTILVLPVSDITGLPFFMDFRSGNKDAAKLISTVMQENKFRGRPGPARVVELSTKLKTYKSNTWFVTSVLPGRDATPEELSACKNWHSAFIGSALQGSDDSDANEDVHF